LLLQEIRMLLLLLVSVFPNSGFFLTFASYLIMLDKQINLSAQLYVSDINSISERSHPF